MKKLFLTGLISFLALSCSKKEDSNVQSTVSTDISTPTNVSGKDLMEASDCTACHQANEKMIGPSYKEIANKYSEKDIELLASKIIEGGSGVWGSVPMAAHPQVSKDDAKKMVEYILSQKK